jgi:hypothetical protein
MLILGEASGGGQTRVPTDPARLPECADRLRIPLSSLAQRRRELRIIGLD